jgi:MurNAc alpha-1-phosphate uridylyltransferase
MLNPPDIDVFILAAGRGERMRPLTDHTPKPLLQIAGKALITHHLERIASLGFKNVVINHAHLGGQIVDAIGTGKSFGLDIRYSEESAGALETAGGIARALPLIRSDPFITLNADIWTDFIMTKLLQPLSHFARLVLVDNPAYHAGGDFYTGPGGLLTSRPSQERLTFSGIAMYERRAFDGVAPEYAPMAPLLHAWIGLGQVEYLHHRGAWNDIGTPERLAELDKQLTHSR